MRPSGRGETESLYLTYPHFSVPDPAARDTQKKFAPAAIVGSAPNVLPDVTSLGQYRWDPVPDSGENLKKFDGTPSVK